MGRSSAIIILLFFFCRFLVTGQGLKENYSLKSYCPSPANQGSLPLCQSYAIAFALSITENAASGQVKKKEKNRSRCSASFINSLLTITEKTTRQASIQGLLNLTTTFGYLTIKEFQEKDFSIRPNEKQLGLAKSRNGFNAWQVKEESLFINDFYVIKKLLKADIPIIVQLKLWDSFQHWKGSNISWKTRDISSYKGVHSLVLIGFNDAISSFDIINSWGKKWGDKGFATIDYKAMEAILLAAYVIVPKEKNDMSSSFFTENFKSTNKN